MCAEIAVSIECIASVETIDVHSKLTSETVSVSAVIQREAEIDSFRERVILYLFIVLACYEI